LVRNRAFQWTERYGPATLDGWSSINGAALSLKNLSTPLSQALQTSLNIAAGTTDGIVGFSNDGYWGMDVKEKDYAGSFWVKGTYTGSFNASLVSNLTGEVFGSTSVKSKCLASEWVEHTFSLTPSKDAPNSNNSFAITFDSAVSQK
jgi:alpha-N-arabinofuranosidase